MDSSETRPPISIRAGRYIAQPSGYRDAGTWEQWLVFFLRGNGHRVLEHLYELPIVSVADVRGLIRTTYPAANDLVARMVDLDILHEFTGQARNRKFIYQSYIRLFADAESETGR